MLPLVRERFKFFSRPEPEFVIFALLCFFLFLLNTILVQRLRFGTIRYIYLYVHIYDLFLSAQQNMLWSLQKQYCFGFFIFYFIFSRELSKETALLRCNHQFILSEGAQSRLHDGCDFLFF